MAEPTNENQQSILYLEDDEALAYVTQRALNNRGFDVLHYAGLETCRDALSHASFDFALLDLKIGNDTSLSLIREIKAIKDVPIVVLTGYGTIRTAVLAMQLGAINFLTKPCEIDDIITALTSPEPGEANETANDDVEKPSLKALEWEAIQRALDENDGNISAAARQLKMHRRTLQRKLNKRHLD